MAALFSDHVVWITGGGTGIGKALALEFGAQGAKVVVSGRRQEPLDGVVGDLRAKGNEALAVLCDVTDQGSQEMAVARIIETFGKLDVVVANAGFGVMGKIEDLELADWKRQFDTNVFGLLGTVKVALPHLRESKGRIGLVGSVSAYVPVPGGGAYVASKHAVRAIGETLTLELADSGVTCTSLHPGYVESDIYKVGNDGTIKEGRKDRRPQNLMWTGEAAAKVMVKALHKRQRERVFTGHGQAAVFLARHAPGAMSGAMRLIGGWGKKKG